MLSQQKRQFYKPHAPHKAIKWEGKMMWLMNSYANSIEGDTWQHDNFSMRKSDGGRVLSTDVNAPHKEIFMDLTQVNFIDIQPCAYPFTCVRTLPRNSGNILSD